MAYSPQLPLPEVANVPEWTLISPIVHSPLGPRRCCGNPSACQGELESRVTAVHACTSWSPTAAGLPPSLSAAALSTVGYPKAALLGTMTCPGAPNPCPTFMLELP
ncbi:hypothetical protein KIL84_006907 [Mauremys mutica]|uniref:Uncharacterized protein n=1 Tax=Mauremys mutica TaxID=74926 RepID=A0A9D3X036_9SAUR|nr:hypothetical protein KIL84_006907 [Mauremys mutica]